MSYEATMCDYDDLNKEQQNSQPNNGSGKEYASYIVIKHNGEILQIKSDAVEPEDASFCRDFSWIVDALEQAYKLGLSDASKKEGQRAQLVPNQTNRSLGKEM